jgi:hypothetical protein
LGFQARVRAFTSCGTACAAPRRDGNLPTFYSFRRRGPGRDMVRRWTSDVLAGTLRGIRPVLKLPKMRPGASGASCSALPDCGALRADLIASTDPVAALPTLEAGCREGRNWVRHACFLAALTSLAGRLSGRRRPIGCSPRSGPSIGRRRVRVRPDLLLCKRTGESAKRVSVAALCNARGAEAEGPLRRTDDRELAIFEPTADHSLQGGRR